MKKDVGYYFHEYLKDRPLFLSMIRAKEAALFSKLMPFKKPVLDIGIGDGYFAKTVFSEIDCGIDINGSRMESARNLNVYKEIKEFNGVDIPYKNGTFGTVVSNCVFEHVEKLIPLLNDIKRVLKKSGILVTTVMAKPWEDNLFGSKLIGNQYQEYMRKKQVHLNLLTKKEWDKAFSDSGFKINRCIGYLNPKACEMIDISHYLSLPSLLTYKLLGRWVILPHIKPYRESKIFSILSEDVDPEKSGALFYILS